ncbi:MAG: hypothetical protein AB1782_17285 [Cyanobacteriota bacterium]
MQKLALREEETIVNMCYANIYFIYGLIYYEKKEYINAIKHFLMAKKFDPSLKDEVEMIIIELIKLNEAYNEVLCKSRKD